MKNCNCLEQLSEKYLHEFHRPTYIDPETKDIEHGMWSIRLTDKELPQSPRLILNYCPICGTRLRKTEYG